MSTVTYTIPNISCGHCVHTIQMEVSGLEGVSLVEASQATQQVVVHYEPPATEEKIQALLIEINYPPVM